MENNDHKSASQRLSELPGLSGDDLKDIEKRLSEVKERTTHFIKEHPLTSMAIAVGIGYLLGKIFSGRRS